MAWFLSPKNLLFCVLAFLLVAIGILFLLQRSTLKKMEVLTVKQASDIAVLQKMNTDLQGQIVDYKANIVLIKKTREAQQQISATTSELQTQVFGVKSVCQLEEEDEKTLSDITYYFNSRGLRRSHGNSNSEAGRKVLSETGPASSDRSGKWTVKQIIANYLILTDYILQLEKTVECYESN